MGYQQDFEKLVASMRDTLAVIHEHGYEWPRIEKDIGLTHVTLHKFRKQGPWAINLSTIYKIASWLDAHPFATTGSTSKR